MTLTASNVMVVRGHAPVLSGVSLSFEARGAVAIVGPNGAGKSMLTKVLAGVEAPSTGDVMVGDRRLSTLSGAARAAAIGYLPQHFEPHWDLSVADLVRLGLERGGTSAAAGALEASLAAHELSELGARRWSTLSGGERARVLLAMVLATDPPVLLADEPAASLDIRHRIAAVRALSERGRQALSVVVMHDLELAFRLFDRIVVMDRGRVAADAPPSALIDDPVLDAVFGVQFARLDTPHGRILHAAP